MPLILNAESWDRERLAKELDDYRDGFGQMAQMFASPPAGLPNPWAVELAGKICQESAALAGALAQLPELTRPVGAAAVNHLYELRNAIPYLVRAGQTPPPPFPSRKGEPAH